MRTAEVCPTCSTYINARCVIYDGPNLSTLNIPTLSTMYSVLLAIEVWANNNNSGGGSTPGTPTTDASLLTSGVLADARVQESNVTQYLGDYVTEAPIDGKDYVRNNEGWVEGVGDGYINGVSFADNLLTFTREGTNAFTGSVDLSSIIETPLEILAKLITVDGNGSGLDAERLGNNLPSVASADNTVPIRNQFGQLRSRWFASDNTSENGINFLFDFTDRPWSFSQGGTGTSASLDLLSNTSANSFRIGTTLSRDEIVINPVNGDITTQGNFIGNGSQLTNLPTNNTTSTRLTANISGATDLDWSTSNQVFEYTLTADASLSDVSLPQGTNTKVIELLVTGDFVLTIPSTWTALPNNDAYNGLIENHIIVSCINGNSGTEKIIYSLTNL